MTEEKTIDVKAIDVKDKKPAKKEAKAQSPEQATELMTKEKEAKKEKKKRYATGKHPVIEAVSEGLFRFQNEAQALDMLKRIHDHWIISHKQEDDPKSVKLWVRGFSITDEEKEKGYLGNFAIIRPQAVDGGRITLKAEKVDVDMSHHPQKKRPKSPHPDWGHPLLRRLKKSEPFETVEEARAIFQKLHEEYPAISIPLTNKLYIIVYSRKKKPPVQKYVFEIKVRDEGGFLIHFEENHYEEKKLPGIAGKTTAVAAKGEEAKEAAAPAKPAGYFTSMVSLKRKKK